MTKKKNMLISETRRLLDKYRPLFLGLLLFSFLSSNGQTYNPSVCCTVSNKSYGSPQAVTTDGRSWFYDATNFVMRDYNGTAEVLSYLNLTKYRQGHYPIYVHTGGILQGNGIWLGGHTLVYWFKDSTDNASLVRWYTDSTGLPGGPFYAIANNLSEGNAGLIKGNLALDLVNNTSDAQKNAATVSLTNHTIDANNNTLLHIPNSSLSNSTIGLTLNNAGATPVVSTTPAALGSSLGLSIPYANGSDSGFLRGTDWVFFHGKLDSVHVSNDSIYNCVNGTCTLQSVLAGGGAVNSVNGTNTSLLFSPTTGNVLGQVNPAFPFNWTQQHTFVSFAPIFSTLNTSGGIFYGNGTGQLLQSAAGTSGQIFESQGGATPIFFTPNASTVNGWLGYTALSSALGSTHIFVGNGSNVATDVAMSGDVGISNTGGTTIQPNAVTTGKINNNAVTYAKIQQASTGSVLLGAQSAGNYQEITLGPTISMAGGVLNAADSALFVTVTHLQKSAALSDTLYRIVYGIPEPTGTGVNGDPIKWIFLTGGGHTFSPDLDTSIFVAGSGNVQIGFPTAQDVSFGNLSFDEKTYPFQQQVIGNLDNFDFGISVQVSGLGANMQGDDSAWIVQSQSLGPYSLTIDTSTQGIISFDLIDATGMYLGATTNGTLVQYDGTRSYHLQRLWTGLTRNYRFQLLDSTNHAVIGNLSPNDRISIFNGSSYFNSIDQRQFLTSTNPYFVGGFPNYWFVGIIKVYPDSLKIIRPINFFAVAGGSAGTVNVSWSAVSNAANGYQLDRSTNPNFSSGVTTLVNLTNVTSFNDSGLSSGTVYYYRLRASRVSAVYSGWELRQVTAP